MEDCVKECITSTLLWIKSLMKDNVPSWEEGVCWMVYLLLMKW